MEETLCKIEFLMDKKNFVARLNSDIGGLREYLTKLGEGDPAWIITGFSVNTAGLRICRK